MSPYWSTHSHAPVARGFMHACGPEQADQASRIELAEPEAWLEVTCLLS